MPDCQHPQCYERLTSELSNKASWEKVDHLAHELEKKMPKIWLRWWWIGFASIGIPIFAAAIGVWSGQQSDILRYANKDAVIKTQEECARRFLENQIRLTRLEEFRVNTRRDLDVIKCNLDEILKLLRGKNHEKKD